MLQMTIKDWFKQGEELYGSDRGEWKFICSTCKTVFARKDFPEGAEAECVNNCIGRYHGGQQGGCNWTLHGLLKTHTKELVTEHGACIPIFRFADEPQDTHATIDIVRHNFTPVDTWAEFESQWPEWVPENVREQIRQFWCESTGRGPRSWLRSMEEQKAPIFGSEAVEKDISGRFVFCWNNMGRIVSPDGKEKVTSF